MSQCHDISSMTTSMPSFVVRPLNPEVTISGISRGKGNEQTSKQVTHCTSV